MLAFFITFFARLAISPLVPLIVEDFEITNTAIGFALTGMWLTYGLTQYPSGVLADRYGEKPIILIAIGGTAISCILIAVAPIFVVFLACVLLLGAAAGLHYAVATSLLARTFDEMGKAVGFHSLGAPLAGLTAPPVVAWVGVRYGWRPAIALTTLVAVPTFVFFVLAVHPTEPLRPEQPMKNRFNTSTVFTLLSQTSIALTLVIAVLTTFIFQAIISFLPTFLVDFRGYSPTFAGIIFSAYFVVRGGAQVGIGSLSDRYGRDFALVGCMIATAWSLSLFVVGAGYASIAAAVLLVGIGGSYVPPLDARFLDDFSDAQRGAGFGLVRTIYVMLGAAGPLVVGAAADLFGWEVSFFILASFALVAVAILSVNWLLNLGY